MNLDDAVEAFELETQLNHLALSCSEITAVHQISQSKSRLTVFRPFLLILHDQENLGLVLES